MPDHDPLAAVDLDTYRPGRRCWVYLAAGWRPAIVLYATVRAVTVRYRLPGQGTAVDTVPAGLLHPADHDEPTLTSDPTRHPEDQP